MGHPQPDLLDEFGPDGIVRGLAALDGRNPRAPAPDQPQLPHLFMPAHHDVRPGGVISALYTARSPPLRNVGLLTSPTCC